MRKIIFLFSLATVCFLAVNAQYRDIIKKTGDAAKYNNSSLLLIFDSTKVDVKETGLGEFYTHKLYKVLSQKGALGINVIKYGYDPLTAYCEIRKVVIYRKNGEVEQLDQKNVMDYPAPARSIYWGAREKMIEVGRLKTGDALEVYIYKKGFSYALLDNDDNKYNPPMKGQFYDIVPFWSDEPSPVYILSKVYKLTLPKDKNLQYKFYYGDVQTTTKEKADKKEYIFTKNDILPFVKETSMVSLYDVAPKLLLSTTDNWKSKSKWFYKVNEDYGSFLSSPEIKDKLRIILLGAKDEMDSISKLTHWSADEIRYSGLSMGEGEGFTLHKGEMTFRDRCGVCKDKAGMLITLLRAAGFKSYPAMTMAGSKIDEIPADHFNHCVTAVKLKNGKFMMLDPTWVPLRRELWSSAEQQQNYLIGTPEGNPLEFTELSPPENHYVKINAVNKITTEGILKGMLTVTAEGQSDAAFRGLFTNTDKLHWKEALESEILQIYPLAKISQIEYGNPYEYFSGPISIKLHYEIPDYAIVTSNEIVFNPLLVSNLFKRGQNQLNFDTTLVQRKYAFRDRCSRLVEISETTTLPKVSNLTFVPKNMSYNGKAVKYKVNYELKNNKLTFNEKIELSKRVYEKEDWADMRPAVINQIQIRNSKLVLKRNNQ